MSKETENKPLSPAKQLWNKIFFVAYVIAFIAAVCFSSFVWYQKTYFTSYWINGQSMWPTLNAETRTAYGTLFNENVLSMNGATGVDFVIGDEHEYVINNVKRFDIVICKYSKSDTYDKIKRIIALPGETFYIDSKEVNNPGNGVVHILNKETNQYEVLEQPLATKYIAVGTYPEKYTNPTTLGEDEYFVMGDNRAHSSDSRENGPVKKSDINAKAIALVARCRTVIVPGSNDLEAVDVQYMWPRFF